MSYCNSEWKKVRLMRWLSNINKTTLFLVWARFIPSLFVTPIFKSLPLEAKEIMQGYFGRPLACICELIYKEKREISHQN